MGLLLHVCFTFEREGKSMRRHNGMRPQDLVILLHAHLYHKNEPINQKVLNQELGICQSEISCSIQRSMLAVLINYQEKVIISNLKEFLRHGFRYTFPAQPGHYQKGLQTRSCFKLSGHKDKYVWAEPGGTAEGIAIKPLHWCLNGIQNTYPKLIQACQLLDHIRMGEKEERLQAIKLLNKLLAN